MLTSLIRFAFITFLFSSAAVFSADKASISTEPSAAQVRSQPISSTKIPEWFYRELTSIRKDVSVLDATGASKEQTQELKERLNKLEAQFNAVQVNTNDRISEQNDRIGDIAEANSTSISLFAAIAGVLGLIIAIMSILSNIITSREAIARAKEEAQLALKEWMQGKDKEVDSRLHVYEVKTQIEDMKRNVFYIFKEEARDAERAKAACKDLREALSSRDSIELERLFVDILFWEAILCRAENDLKNEILKYRTLLYMYQDSSDNYIAEIVARSEFGLAASLKESKLPEDNEEASFLFRKFFEKYHNHSKQYLKRLAQEAKEYLNN